MDKLILEAWDRNNHKIKEWLSVTPQEQYQDYETLLKKALELIIGKDESDDFPSCERVTKVDYGDYQGTLIFIVGGFGYQPSLQDCWYTDVSYGSCSGCDTLLAISSYEDGLPDKEQVEGYWTLCLHMMQSMKRFKGE